MLLAPFSSGLRRLFTAICHNLYYVFMTRGGAVFDQAILTQVSDVGSIPIACFITHDNSNGLDVRVQHTVSCGGPVVIQRQHADLHNCLRVRALISRTVQQEIISPALDLS